MRASFFQKQSDDWFNDLIIQTSCILKANTNTSIILVLKAVTDW